MLLRSSSAPVLSSLLPEGDHESSAFNKPLAAPAHHANPLPHYRGLSSMPMPPMRRAHSETDLQGALLSSSTEADDQRCTGEKKKHHHVHSFSKLPIIEEKDSQLSTSVSEMDKRPLVKEEFMRLCSGKGRSGKQSARSPASPLSQVPAPGIPQVKEGERLNPLLMASGIGISSKVDQVLGGFYGCDGGRGSSGGSSRPSSSPHGDPDTTDLYYQKLLQSDPQNPLFLRNYAQFLSEANHDYNKSEEFYERAILACPSDGEVLSKYAKHVWDVHKDSERAGSYFDQAVKATPDDCYVLASYATFLWEAEEDEEDDIKATQAAFGSLHERRAAPSPLVASG